MSKHWLVLLAGAAVSLLSLPLHGYELGRVGDSLGMKGSQRTLACPAGSQIVGLKIRAGTFVDQLTVLCQHASGNELTGSHFDGPASLIFDQAALLPGISSREELAFCPDGHILAGIKARGGDYVDRIMSLRCVAYRGTRLQYVDVGMGGNGGRIMRPYCRDNDRVVAIETRSGSWLDRMVLSCGVNPEPVIGGTKRAQGIPGKSPIRRPIGPIKRNR